MTETRDARQARPELSADLGGTELLRWYWTLEELTGLARTMGVARGGGKAALTGQLAAPVDGGSVIPPGQRCSQVLRGYFLQAIGPGFHFDAAMREFVAEGAGRTLADAVAHWHATREDAARPREVEEIGEQFEFNRFTSAWHRQHPTGTRAEAVEAWYTHRALPRD